MGFTHGKKARLFANGFDLTSFLKRVGTAARVDVADVTALGATAKSYLVGEQDATLHAEGMFDEASATTADKIDDVLKAALGTDPDVDFTYLPEGDVQGNRGVGVSGHETSYEITAAIGDAVMVSMDAQSDVGAENLRVHHVLQAEGGAGSSAAVDNAASSAAGGVGYLQACAAGPIAAVTAKIRHSSDDITYVDLITFTAFTVRAHERKTVAGTVNRFTKGNWSVASAIPFHLAFGRF